MQGGGEGVCLLIQSLNTGFLPKRDERCPGTRISSSNGLWVGIRFAVQGGSLTVTAVNNGCVPSTDESRDQWRVPSHKKKGSFEKSKNPTTILIRKQLYKKS